MFDMDLFLCVLTLFLTNMYVLDLIHMHIHNDHMFMILVLMFHVLINMLNAMIIRFLTCMYSILRHPCLIWTIILVFSPCLAIMFIIALITCGFT